MKAKKILASVFTVFTTLMILFSGITKAISYPWSVDGLAKVGIPNGAPILGLMEISFLAIFLFPKTMRIGFILLSSYYAGAMATELTHGNSMMAPAIPLLIIWITAFLRDQSIFLLPGKTTF